MSKHYIYLVVIILLCLPFICLSYNYPFFGDEFDVIVPVREVSENLLNSDLFNAAKNLVKEQQSPAKILLKVPIVLIFGQNDILLRLPDFIVWILAIYFLSLIGYKIGGFLSGLSTAIILSLSKLYLLETLVYGLGFYIIWISLLMLNILDREHENLFNPKNKKQYYLGGLFCVLAFLWYPNGILIAFSYHALALYQVLRKKYKKLLKQFFLHTLPFIVFYLLFYGVFLGGPYIAHKFYGHSIMGQLRQHLIRTRNASLGFRSVVDNLSNINTFFFPYLSWLFLLFGLIYKFIKNRTIFLILLLHFLMFNFYFNNTYPHLLSNFIWVIPWAVAGFFSLKKIKLPLKTIIVTLISLSIGLWTYYFNYSKYTTDYPIKKMQGFINQNLNNDKEGYILAIGGLDRGYYFPFDDGKRIGHYAGTYPLKTYFKENGLGCYLPNPPEDKKIRVLITSYPFNPCSEIIEKEQMFPGTDLTGYIFSL